ncbi:hypothetical protein GCM10017556_17840 [Micromonospora sagamiensis]|nr:hypothetical protein GCM10017556_17840 [Micromonospora sagamiensis]
MPRDPRNGVYRAARNAALPLDHPVCCGMVLPLPLPRAWPSQALKVLQVSACLPGRGRVKG